MEKTEKAPKEVKPKKQNKVKTPKVKLITYTVKAIIPTGAYANIQPEVVVQAETLEQAERAVMPHIEALFAKYREGVPMNVPVAPTVTPNKVYVGDDLSATTTSSTTAVAPAKPAVPTTNTGPTPAIAMSEPFNRAVRAIETCATIEATQLIEDQLKVSVKLTNDEKQQLFTKVLLKRKEINGKNEPRG